MPSPPSLPSPEDPEHGFAEAPDPLAAASSPIEGEDMTMADDNVTGGQADPPESRTASDRRAADLVDAFERATERLAAAAGQERGDQLRRQAESLAYRSAMDHVADLHRIENTLVASVARDWDYSGPGTVHALDIIRTFMSRGLIRANLEIGDRDAFWVPR
jgi:hypothetical protein